MYDDNSLKVKSCEKYQEIGNAHEGGVTQLAISKQDNDFLVSCGRDNFIKIWNINQNKCIRKLAGHTEFVLNMLLLERSLTSDEFDSRDY